MTDSNDEAGRPDGEGNDGEQDKGLDELQSVSTSLRSAQHRGCESDASVDAAGDDREDSKQSAGDAPAADPDGLDELQPVSTSLRSAQSQADASDAGMANDAGEDDDGERDASDTSGSDDD